MKNLRKIYKYSLLIISQLLILLLLTKSVLSNDIFIEIKGNNFTDEDVIISFIEKKPTEISTDYSNYIIKSLNESSLFENVSVEIIDNKYVVTISEFANINRVYFNNNERFEDEELEEFSNELALNNLNPIKIDLFISEIEKLYQSFGYNNIQITFSENKNSETNISDLIFDINEGKITKIKNIYFRGNNSISREELKSTIKSKTKTLINIFANNNYKKFEVDNDARLIEKYYKDFGYIDVAINYSIEYLKSNKVNIYFDINEGNQYSFKEFAFLDNNNLLNKDIEKLIDDKIKEFDVKDAYSVRKINELSNNISQIIISNGVEFFEIKSLEKTDGLTVSVLYDIISVNPQYTNQINIYGNTRTFDKVIRRELNLVEGDAIYKSQIPKIQKKLNSLKLFKSVSIIEKEVGKDLVDLEINVEETQTGTFNAGLSIGTIEGLGAVAGLTERNFYGTGRSVKALLNTTDDRKQFTLETTDRLFYENDVDVTYRASYKQEDFSVASSYKLDSFLTGVGFAYKINPDLRHSIDLDYQLKDYIITDSSSVSTAIENSSGESASFILKNNLYYSTLNSLMLPKEGKYINYTNFIESPTSSSNGLIKNVVTFKNFKNVNKNIYSFQARVGNVVSLNDSDILTDDKFSLGGRWLRGFDSFGAGPRNSRTSYIGGNNIIVTKLDYSREISRNSDFPFYLNIFNDYGLLWENKTKPTNNDNSIRSSVGFGFKYYSPIGPIGFTWGFPIADESYDIKRMFLFSVGNID